MEVILLEKIHNLGNLGDKIQVKPGYGRNFLIPQGKAVPATTKNVEKFEVRRAELEKNAAEKLAAAQKRAEQLKDISLTLFGKPRNEEGQLFGSINVREIADALAAKGIQVEKREINFTDGPIRYTGEHEVDLQLYSDVVVKLKVKVESEQ